MANSYATIASGGMRNRPIAIEKVVFPGGDGKVVNLGKPRRTRAFQDGVTAKATQILKQNMTSGTGGSAQIGCPAAGKTGTTDEFTDAWFVGYTPNLSTAVWVGFPNTRVEMKPPVTPQTGQRRLVPGADLGPVHEGRQARLQGLQVAEDRVQRGPVLRQVRHERGARRRR
jgi:membrane peptidoglycan carboxypeptidase